MIATGKWKRVFNSCLSSLNLNEFNSKSCSVVSLSRLISRNLESSFFVYYQDNKSKFQNKTVENVSNTWIVSIVVASLSAFSFFITLKYLVSIYETKIVFNEFIRSNTKHNAYMHVNWERHCDLICPFLEKFISYLKKIVVGNTIKLFYLSSKVCAHLHQYYFRNYYSNVCKELLK